MTRTMRSTVLIFAGTLAGMAGCRHSPELYSSPARPGIESCPSRSFPSDYHPPAPPSAYFPGPLNSKKGSPPQAAPREPVQVPLIEEGPETPPLPQAPLLQAPPGQEEGPAGEDDSTAGLGIERQQLMAEQSRSPWNLSRRLVQPVQLLQAVEPDVGRDELTELDADPIPATPTLQSPRALPVPEQPLAEPVCGVAPSYIELPPSSTGATSSASGNRTTLLQKLKLRK